jgi:ribosomal protein L29
MDTKSLRAKNPEVLSEEKQKAQTRIKELRFKISSNQWKDVREVRELKRLIARINTLLGECSKNQSAS